MRERRYEDYFKSLNSTDLNGVNNKKLTSSNGADIAAQGKSFFSGALNYVFDEGTALQLKMLVSQRNEQITSLRSQISGCESEIDEFNVIINIFGITEADNRDYTLQRGRVEGQKTAASEQLSKLESTSSDQYKQITLLREQGQGNVSKAGALFNDYLVKLAEHKTLELQLPVSYLIDQENKILGFNTYGDLCAVFDSCENYIAVVYGEIETSSGTRTVITVVYGGEESTVFAYNRAGQLTSITDPQGKKTSYDYFSSSESAQLKSVTFADGKIVTFAYNGDDISNINSSDKTRTYLSYNSLSCLTGINNKSMAAGYAYSGAFGETPEGQSVSVSSISYSDNYAAINTDGAVTEYYLDLFGGLKGKQSKYPDGSARERLAYAYLSHDKSWGYRVAETDDTVWTYGTKTTSAGALVATLNSSPVGKKEFVLSALAESQNLPNETSMQLKSAFKTIPATLSAKYEIRTEIVYPSKTETFIASFDYRTKDKQLVLLPVTVDRNATPTSINIYVEYSGHTGSATFNGFRFAPAEYEYFELNDYRNATKKESGLVLLNADASGDTYSKSVTAYTYDENNKLTCERVTVAVYKGAAMLKTDNAVTKYAYSGAGRPMRTESYIEGEEKNAGINVQENVYDEKGRKTKSFSYNTLDSSTKFYSESIIAENGQVTADIDESGENKTEYEYTEGNNNVKAVTNPDGGKIVYSRDVNVDRISAITQSTAEGEANSTDMKYTCGLLTKLKSGLNTVSYEYDHKHRKTKVEINGNEYASYDYTEDVSSESVVIGGITFSSVNSDKVTSKLKDSIKGDATTEIFTDKHGNLRKTAIGGVIQIAGEYDTDGTLSKSGDNLTGSVTAYEYDSNTKKVKTVSRRVGADTEALSESYNYNGYGQVSERKITGAVNHTYGYEYKNNAARDLDSVTLPNGLVCKPVTDVNGRTSEQLFVDASGNNKFGSYTYYKKVGDHATNQISSIRYGGIKNGEYVILDGLKYSYDKNGNISEIYENGKFIAKYTYDKINRLVREDNKKLNSTYVFAYDNNGNILSKSRYAYTLSDITELNALEDKTYGYIGNNSDSLAVIESSDGSSASFTYDKTGNPTSYKGNILVWQKGRQLASYGDLAFIYNGYGKRVKKDNTAYVYDNSGKLLKQSDGTNVLEFIYDGTGDLCCVKHNSTNYVYRKNLQGDITHVLDTSGNVVVQYAYDAWGNHTVTDGNGTVITSSTHIGNLNPFRYRSYFFDTETKLYFLQTRYYDPETGRFINADNISVLNESKDLINGLNLYNYCGSNPVNRADPTGHSWESFWQGVGNWFVGVGNWINNNIFQPVGNFFTQTLPNFFVNTVWNDWIVGGLWNTFCVDWVWNTFCVDWVWNTFCVDWVAGGVVAAWNWTKNAAISAWNWTKNAAIATWSWLSVDEFRHLKAIFELIAAIGAIAGGIALLLAPEPTGLSKFAGWAAIVGGLGLAGFAISEIIR